jgi:hypothetical protein
VSGARVAGAVRWSKHPRRREDGVLIPDAHGVIETDDGARIVFHLGGYSTALEGSPTRRGIDFETLRLQMSYFAAVGEAT